MPYRPRLRSRAGRSRSAEKHEPQGGVEHALGLEPRFTLSTDEFTTIIAVDPPNLASSCECHHIQHHGLEALEEITLALHEEGDAVAAILADHQGKVPIPPQSRHLYRA